MIEPRGRADAPIVIVGDAPTDDDYAKGVAFSGYILDLMLDVLGDCEIPADDVVFINAVTFTKSAKRGPLTRDDIRPDADQHLIPFIAEHPRQLVIALGNNALCAIGVMKKPEKINSCRSKSLESEILSDAGVMDAGCKIAASIHPYFVIKEPELADEFFGDFSYAKRLCEPDFRPQAPMEVRDIENYRDFEHLVEAVKRDGEVAYDYETTSLDAETAIPVCMSLCTGEQKKNGDNVVWFWAGYDCLKPRFDARILEGFRTRFVNDLLVHAGTWYDLVAFNMTYDDWVSETWAGHHLPGSQYDAMIMKWTVNNKRPHNLKHTASRYLGYPNYDAAVDEAVKEIGARRNRILTHPDDLFVLEYFGHEPLKAKTGFKWPPNVEKKLAAFALQPFETLRVYNCYDSLYTLMAKNKLGRIIDKHDLAFSCDFRHRVAKRLMRTEQRGMLVDKQLNREFSRRMQEVEDECQVLILNKLKEIGINRPDFNARSPAQLIQVLYGEPTMLPFIDSSSLAREWHSTVAQDRCEIIEEEVYGEDFSKVRSLLDKDLEVDTEAIKTTLVTSFKQRFRKTVETYEEPIYLKGIYEPIGHTKSGQPSTAGAVLTTLYQQEQNPLLALILMQRRANKLRGTFVDGVYSRMDQKGVLHSRFNPIGTETGRISSSNPNGQNFQKYIRGQLIPRPGFKFLEWDLSQAEIRGVAAESGDPALVEALDASDIHTRIASLIFNISEHEVDNNTHRKFAKTIVFGLIYGMSAFRLSMAIGVSVEEAEEFMVKFFSAFPVMKEWLDHQVWLAHQPPYYVYTPWGTRRSTRNVQSMDRKVVAHTERIACVDAETEILTLEGWKTYNTLSTNDLILGKNVETGVLRWQAVSSVNVYPDYEGPVYRVNTKSFSAVCNPEHRWIVYNKASKRDEFRQTQDMSLWGDHRIHKTGDYQANGTEAWTDAEVALIGWILTDGSYKAKCRTIELHQWKPEGVATIQKVLNDWGGDFSTYPKTRCVSASKVVANHHKGYCWSICGEFSARVRRMFPLRRLTPHFMVELSRRQLDILFHHMMAGDGSIAKPTTPNDKGKQVFTCRDEEVADAFQMLLVLTGKSGNKHWQEYDEPAANGSTGCWYVNVHRRDKAHWQGKDVEVKNERLLLWCPTVPDGSFVARRAGKTYITGNTNMPIQGGAGELTLWHACEVMDAAESKGFDVYMVNTTHDSVAIEVPTELAWKVDGYVMGPMADIVRRVIATPPPVHPLNTVKWKADVELNDWWSAKPDLMEALDPGYRKREKAGKIADSTFRWDLITPETTLDPEDLNELRDFEEAMTGMTNY